jgi:TRAP-type C4-dicarboxylate transport system permease small subunit
MRTMNTLSLGLARLGSLAIVVMVAVTVADVTGRLLFGLSLVGTYDIVQLALVVAVYGGLAQASAQGAHIAVDLLNRAVGERVGHLLAATALASSLLVLVVLTWLAAGEARDAYRLGDTTSDLAIPKYLHWIGIVVGLAAGGTATAVRLADAVRPLVRHEAESLSRAENRP